MDLVIETSRGTIPLAGQLGRAGPVVLAVNGAYAAPSALSTLADFLPETNVLVGRLPGNHAPWLLRNRFSDFVAAYSEAIQALARPVILLGASVGGLVALASKAPNLAAIIAADPPLRTAKLWPLHQDYQRRWAVAGPPEREFLSDVLGISGDLIEDRDYTHLADAVGAPTRIIIGGEPLFPPRSISELPGLIDEPERIQLRSTPAVSVVTVAAVGHNIPGRAADVLIETLRNAVAAFSS